MSKFFSLFIFFFASLSGFTQTTSFEFLNYNYSARVAATGDQILTATGSPGVGLQNPASLYGTTAKTFGVRYSNYLLDIYGAQAFYAQPYKFKFMDSTGYFSLQVIGIDYGSVDEVDKFGYTTGRNASAGDFALVAGWSSFITPDLVYGINLKFAYSSLDSYSSSGFFTDFGLIYTIPSLYQVKLAIVAANLGFFTSTYTSSSQDIPVDLRVGLSKQLAHLPLTFHFAAHGLNHKSTEYVNVSDRWNAGIEFKFHPMVTIRLGLNRSIQKSMKLENGNGFTGATMGFGIRYQKSTLNFAYKNYGDAGNPILLGLNYIF